MSVPGWRTAALVTAALVTGAIVGSPLAQAAATATGLVRIEGGGSTRQAIVSKSGQLSVNTGLATTPAGQLQIASASPKALVDVFGTQTCSANGFYAPPPGEALIITAVTFNSEATSSFAQLSLFEGKKATPCGDHVSKGLIANGIQEGNGSLNQVFPSGIVVPAGDALGLTGVNDSGTAEIYGYLVPASAAWFPSPKATAAPHGNDTSQPDAIGPVGAIWLHQDRTIGRIQNGQDLRGDRPNSPVSSTEEYSAIPHGQLRWPCFPVCSDGQDVAGRDGRSDRVFLAPGVA